MYFSRLPLTIGKNTFGIATLGWLQYDETVSSNHTPSEAIGATQIDSVIENMIHNYPSRFHPGLTRSSAISWALSDLKRIVVSKIQSTFCTDFEPSNRTHLFIVLIPALAQISAELIHALMFNKP